MPAKRIVVHGQVQGVGFRYFVSRRAAALGIRGEVWNRRDGSVELVAVHESEKVLTALIQTLREGPGSVSNVESESIEAPSYESFEIGATR